MLYSALRQGGGKVSVADPHPATHSSNDHDAQTAFVPTAFPTLAAVSPTDENKNGWWPFCDGDLFVGSGLTMQLNYTLILAQCFEARTVTCVIPKDGSAYLHTAAALTPHALKLPYHPYPGTGRPTSTFPSHILAQRQPRRHLTPRTSHLASL